MLALTWPPCQASEPPLGKGTSAWQTSVIRRFHLIAPDLPSFGFTTTEDGEAYQFSFAGLTKTIQGFVNELSLRRFAMYVFDYGAPVGFNLAVANPDRITAIVSQNGSIRGRTG
ncbi:MAG: alpha/beta fold hydrolase [Vulcanimicrobiaceae bacterium]